MYMNCLCVTAQYYRNRNSKNNQCCKTIFHIHLVVSYYCFIPQFHSCPKMKAALKASTTVNTSQLWNALSLWCKLTNRRHHTPYGKTSSILHLQWKTKLKQIWSTATATSQNRVLLTFSGQDVVYYKHFWFCNLLHSPLLPTLQTGIFPLALVCNSILPSGWETNLSTRREKN